jgi:hypothetical protein
MKKNVIFERRTPPPAQMPSPIAERRPRASHRSKGMSCKRGKPGCFCAAAAAAHPADIGEPSHFMAAMGMPVDLGCAAALFEDAALPFTDDQLADMLDYEPADAWELVDAAFGLRSALWLREDPLSRLAEADEGLWSIGIVNAAAGLSGLAATVDDIPWMLIARALGDAFGFDTSFLDDAAEADPAMTALWHEGEDDEEDDDEEDDEED